MGRGRKPIPKEEHIRRGTYQPIRHAHSIEVVRGVPDKPGDLLDTESAEWDRLVLTYLDRLSKSDGDYLKLLAQAEVRLRDLKVMVDRSDGEYDAHSKAIRADWKEERKLVMDLHAHFGGSPSTRMKIPKATPKEQNPWSDIGVRATASMQ